MTDLKNYDLAENMISPDDLKQSEQHGADRLNTQSEIAEGRVKEISVNRTATGVNAGGLDQFFDEFERHTWTNEMPWELANQVSTRVMNIVGQSATEYQNSLQGSSSATLERQMLRYTQVSVLAKIDSVRTTGIHSLQTLETLKGFTAKAQAEAVTQRADMVTKQKEAIDNRGWWSRVGHKALTIGSLGTYALVKTEKRQKWYNSIVEKSMTREFDRINRNIETLEGQVGKQIAPMQSRIRRTIASQADPNTKAAYRTELMNALRHRGTLATMDLNTNWGIPNANEQEKIDFLEAAQGLDFVKKDLGIVGVSSAKNLQQKQMIESAQEQQNIVKTPGQFKFDQVQGKVGFKELSIEGVSAPEVPALVKMLENELASSENLEALYAADINKADLLTDSVKLILLVKRINGAGFNAEKKLQVTTRQSLLAWIKYVDKNTGGETLEWKTGDRTQVENVEKLFDNTIAGSLTKTADDCFTELSARKINNAESAFKTAEDNVITLSNKIFSEKQKFENLVGTLENFPEKDKKDIEDAFAKIEPIRATLVKIAAQWRKDKKQNLHQSASTSDLKDVLDDAEGRLNTELAKAIPADKNAALAHTRIVQGLQSERDKANKAYLESKSKKDGLTDFSSDLVRLRGELNALFAKELTLSDKKEPNLGDLNERIQQKLRAESFGDEIDKKFVEQLEKNDQFEQLKNVSKGTNVEITYKKTAASSLRFPDQLGGSTTENFIVVESNEKGVLLEKVGGGEVIAILGAAAKGGEAYKNAKIATTHSDNPLLPRGPSNMTVSGAWDSAIALNYKIAA
jgi:hypothetical protein